MNINYKLNNFDGKVRNWVNFAGFVIRFQLDRKYYRKFYFNLMEMEMSRKRSEFNSIILNQAGR